MLISELKGQRTLVGAAELLGARASSPARRVRSTSLTSQVEFVAPDSRLTALVAGEDARAPSTSSAPSALVERCIGKSIIAGHPQKYV